MTLDGSASSDPDSDPLTYLWTAPAGIVLSDPTAVNPTFTAPDIPTNVPVDYEFSLVVDDGMATDSRVASDPDIVVITVNNINQAPIANAGSDQTVTEFDVVTLDGSASYDPDLDPITYLWTSPTGITLSDPTAVNPTFTAPEVFTNDPVDYEFTLVVDDGITRREVSDPDTIIVTVQNINEPPIANAGADQTVDEGDFVTLDGSSSSDPDSDPLTYLWTAPTGIALSDPTAVNPTFTAPDVIEDTDYVITLIVNDLQLNSEPDSVTITVLWDSVYVNELLPKVTKLLGNYPNPFNPTTTIRFSLCEPGVAKIDIYNIKGRLVKHLLDCEYSVGYHNVIWDGADNSGKQVSSGVYFYRMKTQTYTEMCKMLMIK